MWKGPAGKNEIGQGVKYYLTGFDRKYRDSREFGKELVNYILLRVKWLLSGFSGLLFSSNK